MSLPVIAIIISGFSATLAAASWTVAYATFLRGRPRVQFRNLTYDSIPIPYEYWTGPGNKLVNAFFVRVVNASSVPTTIERVDFQQLRHSQDRRELGVRRRAWRPVINAFAPNWIEGEEKVQLEAFSSVSWIVRPDTPFIDPEDMKALRLSITLANGQSVTTRWFPTQMLADEDARLRTLSLSIHPYVARIGPTPASAQRQLSFDDLPQGNDD
ncbi:hypothetical protein ABZT06_04440 [Streptomyces sp. NPDC005483]|uniref:hypothetical protein n=1 Tax=Streptomyces sp. NPDC005483 TaxID=3154882 RepID=UPI0033AD5C50